MLKNNTGKRKIINWKGKWLHVDNGDVVDLPSNYAVRYNFDVVEKKVGKPKVEKFDAMDVNKDGKVDMSDVVEVVKKVVKKTKKKLKKKY